jgi:hypothetical protein
MAKGLPRGNVERLRGMFDRAREMMGMDTPYWLPSNRKALHGGSFIATCQYEQNF